MGNSTILHVSKTSNGGRFIGFQLPHLVHSGFKVHIALPSSGTLAEMAVRAGATVHYLPELASADPLRAAPSLAALFTRLEPLIVHTHFVHSTLAARAGREISGKRFVNFFQVPGPLHLESRWSRELDIRTARRHDQWGAACTWSRDVYLASGVAPERVHLTYYGKNLDDYPTEFSLAQRQSTRLSLGVPDSTFLATMIAHIYKPRPFKRRGIKGHEDFITAIAHARREDPSVAGVIVGGPRPGAEEYYDRLRHLAAEHSSGINFLGHRTDVNEIYRATDVAVHPSISENIGGAGESLLLRVPTISTNVGGFPDAVIHGRTGLTVNPRSPQQLAAAMLYAKRNMSAMHDAAEAGRRLMTILGDATRNAAIVAELYKEIGATVGSV